MASLKHGSFKLWPKSQAKEFPSNLLGRPWQPGCILLPQPWHWAPPWVRGHVKSGLGHFFPMSTDLEGIWRPTSVYCATWCGSGGCICRSSHGDRGGPNTMGPWNQTADAEDPILIFQLASVLLQARPQSHGLNPYKQVEHSVAGLLWSKLESDPSTLGLACNVSRENWEILLQKYIPDVKTDANKDALNTFCPFYLCVWFALIISNLCEQDAAWMTSSFPTARRGSTLWFSIFKNQHASPVTTYKMEIKKKKKKLYKNMETATCRKFSKGTETKGL